MSDLLLLAKLQDENGPAQPVGKWLAEFCRQADLSLDVLCAIARQEGSVDKMDLENDGLSFCDAEGDIRKLTSATFKEFLSLQGHKKKVRIGISVTPESSIEPFPQSILDRIDRMHDRIKQLKQQADVHKQALADA